MTPCSDLCIMFNVTRGQYALKDKYTGAVLSWHDEMDSAEIAMAEATRMPTLPGLGKKEVAQA